MPLLWLSRLGLSLCFCSSTHVAAFGRLEFATLFVGFDSIGLVQFLPRDLLFLPPNFCSLIHSDPKETDLCWFSIYLTILLNRWSPVVTICITRCKSEKLCFQPTHCITVFCTSVAETSDYLPTVILCGPNYYCELLEFSPNQFCSKTPNLEVQK